MGGKVGERVYYEIEEGKSDGHIIQKRGRGVEGIAGGVYLHVKCSGGGEAS